MIVRYVAEFEIDEDSRRERAGEESTEAFVRECVDEFISVQHDCTLRTSHFEVVTP